MDEILMKIENAELGEIDELLGASMDRKRELFPEWEILYLAMPKYDSQRWKQILDQVYEYLVLGKDS